MSNTLEGLFIYEKNYDMVFLESHKILKKSSMYFGFTVWP